MWDVHDYEPLDEFRQCPALTKRTQRRQRIGKARPCQVPSQSLYDIRVQGVAIATMILGRGVSRCCERVNIALARLLNAS